MSVLKVRGIRHDAAASDAINLDSSGNVGIGTSTPATAGGTALAVHDSSSPRIRLTNTATGQTSSDGSEFSLSGSDLYIENRESGNIIFYRGAERMRIDSSGRITKPSQPAFHATSNNASYQSISSSSAFPFNTSRHNIGSHYNTGTYRFTAPINGLYAIYFSVFFEDGLGAIGDVCLYVNGSQLGTGGGSAEMGSRYGTQRVTVNSYTNVSLNSSDYVEVRARSGTNTNCVFGPHSVFCGYLLG